MSEATQSNRPWRLRRLMMVALLAIGAFALVATACGDDDDDDDTDTTTETPTEATEATEEPTEATEEATETEPAGENGEGGENGGETTLNISAEDDTAFSTDSLTAPADTPFVIVFENNDEELVHNIAVLDQDGETIDATELETGPVTQELEFDGLEAGEYDYLCEAHPTTMTGVLTVE